MKSKTVILSSPNNTSQGRAILTLFKEDGLLQCRLRLYNTPELTRFCKIGIYHQKEVYSANLLLKNRAYNSSLVGDFDMDKDFYAAIVDTAHENNVMLAGGTYAGFYFNDQSDVFNNIDKENPNTNIFDYTEQVNVEDVKSEEICDCEESDCEVDKCKNCKYKEFFYSAHKSADIDEKFAEENEFDKVVDLSEENLQHYVEKSGLNEDDLKTENNEKEHAQSVLAQLIPQFQYVFENYQADEVLNKLIPNGKFVQINENQEQYSIGALYEDEQMRYICYAVKKDYNEEVPQELGKHYQWIPLDKEDPLSEGYYIVFQDASDLKIVEL